MGSQDRLDPIVLDEDLEPGAVPFEDADIAHELDQGRDAPCTRCANRSVNFLGGDLAVGGVCRRDRAAGISGAGDALGGEALVEGGCDRGRRR